MFLTQELLYFVSWDSVGSIILTFLSDEAEIYSMADFVTTHCSIVTLFNYSLQYKKIKRGKGMCFYRMQSREFRSNFYRDCFAAVHEVKVKPRTF